MDLLDRLVAAYSGAADPANAAPMRKYLRDRYPFLGIQSTRRRELDRTVRAGQPPPTGDDLRAVALACWELPEREYRYFACDHLRRYARGCRKDRNGDGGDAGGTRSLKERLTLHVVVSSVP